MQYTEKFIISFFNRVEKSDTCWNWIGAHLCTTTKHKNKPYGIIQINKKIYKVHRISYEIHYGISPGKMYVLHNCDNPRCVNPLHLRIGTHQDNMNDAVIRKRFPYNDNHWNCKLSINDIELIKKDNRSTYKIALEYGVNQSTIYRIKHNQRRRNG